MLTAKQHSITFNVGKSIYMFLYVTYVCVNADRSDNDETLLILNFIKLTKTCQQKEEYDMVKLQLKTDNIR